MKTDAQMKLSKSKVWHGRHRDVGFKISLSGEGEDSFMDGLGTWCFYVFIAEDAAANFPALWLADEIHRWKPEAKGRITHDYCSITGDMEFHGGCTFYQKHGHTDGYRYVEMGCDYAHLWDRERGGYVLEEILYDAKKCIDSLYENGVLKPETAKAP